ncbi:DUF6573 family protein [Streptomyces sp. NPDC087297]|uniref:DUF6573 family protein n=1 Tax=Streptomyces sp. NPDC087297 TaxID=3365778 RepID=UPI003805A855
MDMNNHGPLAASYTRAEAFEDGVVIRVPGRSASAAGIGMPVAITPGARQEFVAGDDGGEDERLNTVLSAVAGAVERAPSNEVCFVVQAGELPAGQVVSGADRLIAITETGPSGDPVMTLILPHEM